MKDSEQQFFESVKALCDSALKGEIEAPQAIWQIEMKAMRHEIQNAEDFQHVGLALHKKSEIMH